MTTTRRDLSELPALPHDEAGPVFAEPWQASAFALAVSLSHQGHFTWKEWAATLGEELRDRKQAWADAFRRTPHGQPVELPNATSD